MHISLNELVAALKKYFEAKFYFPGNIEDATNMIVWLEKHGVNGLYEFEQSIKYLDLDDNKSFSSVIYEDQSLAVIDCHDRSALNCIASAVDLAQAKALEGGIATITLKRCHNRKFILKALADGGRRGMSLSAYWQNFGSEPMEYTASIKAGDQYPTFSWVALDHESQLKDEQSLILTCSTQVDLMYECKKHSGNRTVHRISPDEMYKYQLNIVKNGFMIQPDLWGHINDVGLQVLVKESLQSQMGAGGA